MSKLTAVGCYIFAGGFAVGVSKHFKLLAHLEDGDFGVASFKLNYPKVPVYIDPSEWPLRELKNKVDFIYSNPPCAPWSQTGKGWASGPGRANDNWKTDPRVDCVRKSFSAFQAIRPHVWVWESVTRAYTAGRDFVDELTAEILKMGYSVTYLLTDAQLHGLPQRRQRFHLIAHDVELQFPEPLGKIVTAGEALKGVKSPWVPMSTPRMLKLIKATPQGVGLRRTFDKLNPHPKLNERGEIKGRPVWMNYRIRANRPSGTLIGGCHAVHPDHHRFLSPWEHAALCGYPPTFKFAGEPRRWYKQIAQAVTPVIGDYLGGVVKRGIKRGVKTRREVNVVDFRRLVRNYDNAR